MRDNGLTPDAAIELQLLRAEIAALRTQLAPASAMPAMPDAVPRLPKWLPKVHDKHLVLPEQHYRLMRWLGHGVTAGGSLWRHNPHVRTDSELTFGERAADVMRNAFGSWTFVSGFLAFMAVWMTVNSLLLGHSAFDKYPYILLNLCLSMMAGLQGALILIAAKRADRISAEQAIAHYAETSKLDTLQTANNEMTERIEQATALLGEIHQHVTALAPLAGKLAPDEKA